MTERTRSPHARPAEERRAPEGTVDEGKRARWSATSVRLRVALGLSVVAAALMVLGPAMKLVHNAPAAGFSAMPLLVALAVLVPLLATAAIWLGRPVLAAGLLIGPALLAPGRALVDLQFASDATLAARPELMVPTSLAPLPASAGLWLLLAGHAVVALAGLVAAGTGATEPDDRDEPAERPDSTEPAGPTEPAAPTRNPRQYLMGWAFACATAATVGLILPAFHSSDAFLLARDVIDSPSLVRIGGLLVVAGVVLGCVLATSSERAELTKGMLVGLFASVAAVTLPEIVAGLQVPRLRPAFGPYFALIMIGLLVVAAFVLPGRLAALRPWLDRRQPPAGELADERRLADRLHLVAGALGVLAGLAALAGGRTNQLTVDAGLEQPDSYANRQLVPVAALIGVLGFAMLIRRTASTVRPAFTVSLASVFLVGAGTLDADLTATAASPEVHLGVGVWFVALAMILAAIAAGLAALAGAAERDDVDLTERGGTNLSVIVPAAAAVLLAIGAFGMPAMRASDFVAPGIWSEFRLASWGLLLALVVVIVVAVLAPASRPAQAASLLLGAAALVGIHLLELPLTGARATNATAAQGTWLSLACVVALIVAALAAMISRPAQARR